LRVFRLACVAALSWAVARHVPALDVAPEHQAPFAAWITAAIHATLTLNLANGLTLQHLLRSLAPLLDAPIHVFDAVFAAGLMSGSGDALHQRLPPLSWLGLGVAVGLGSWRFGGRASALWALATFFYLQIFILWPDSVETLAQMALAVPISVFLGFTAGVFLHRHPALRPAALTLLDQAQTVPLFAYLVPLVLFLGLGTAPAVCAVVIFAMPPMVRTAVVSLDESAARFGELAAITGCTPSQRLWKVLVPTAAPLLRLGLNQVILLSFSSAILASLVGASGLGNDVLVALQQLAIGRGLVAGLAITALAISLDKLLQGWTEGRGRLRFLPASLFWPSIMAVPVVLTLLEPWCPGLAHFPAMLTVHRTTPVDNAVDWLVTNLYAPIAWLQWLLATCLLFPLKAALMSVPWSVALVVVAYGGWRLGGYRQAIFLGAPIILMACAGIWPEAQQTIYLTTAGSVLALLVGIPVGIVAARAPRFGAIALAVVDTLQTLPPFIYLIPVVMLLGSGDLPSIIAVALFAICPAVRYTEAAIRTLPSELVEAGLQMGCTPWQLIVKIALPVSRQRMILGLSQTVLMALSMVVITALIGTTDLGQMTLTAVSEADPGAAAVAGLAIAALGTIADRLLTGRFTQN
jgi:glycine betaine/proline transport system permease protein